MYTPTTPLGKSGSCWVTPVCLQPLLQQRWLLLASKLKLPLRGIRPSDPPLLADSGIKSDGAGGWELPERPDKAMRRSTASLWGYGAVAGATADLTPTQRGLEAGSGGPGTRRFLGQMTRTDDKDSRLTVGSPGQGGPHGRMAGTSYWSCERKSPSPRETADL